MPQKEMLAAFETHSKFMQKITHSVIEWDPVKQKWVYNTSLLKTFLWRCHLIVHGVVIVATLYLLYAQLSGAMEDTPLPVLIFHLIGLLMSSWVCGSGLAMITYGRDVVEGCNTLYLFHQELQTIQQLPKGEIYRN